VIVQEISARILDAVWVVARGTSGSFVGHMTPMLGEAFILQDAVLDIVTQIAEGVGSRRARGKGHALTVTPSGLEGRILLLVAGRQYVGVV